MAVFRVERNRNFTVMANYHLKDKTISLKAKGLLSMLLSLPDTWIYSIKGLARICKEGVDAIRTALQELVKAGYVICSRKRDARGQLKGADYTIYEKPQTAEQTKAQEEESTEPDAPIPVFALPVLDEPVQESPVLDNPILESPPQINNNILSPAGMDNPFSVTPKKKINKKTTKENPYPSNPYQSQAAWVCQMPAPMSGGMGSMMPSLRMERQANKTVAELQDEIQKRIGYEALSQEYGREEMDEIVGIIMGVMMDQGYSVQLKNSIYPASFVKTQFERLNSQHIIDVFDSLKKTGSDIHNTRKYLTACLLNAALSLSNHTNAKMRHNDFCQAESARFKAEEAAFDAFMDTCTPEFWEEIKREAYGTTRKETTIGNSVLPATPAFGGYRDHGVLGYCAG